MSDPIHRMASSGGQMLVNLARFASRPAVSDGTTDWTYRELAEIAARYIAVWKQCGLASGDGIAILAGNRAEVVAVAVAATLMGLRDTSLHPLAAEDDHAFIVDDAEIAALVVEPEKYCERARVIQQRAPKLKHIFSFGPLDGAVDLNRAATQAEPQPLRDECDPAGLASIVYTGGTTGRSKGAMHTHRSIQMAEMLMAADWDWPPEARFLASTPISHAAGAMLRPVMFRGGYTRLLQGFNPETFCQTVQEERITCTLLVPTLIYALLDYPNLRAFDLSSLQMIVYGAAPMSPDRLKQALDLFGPVFVQIYGQTEAPVCVTTLRKIDHDPEHPTRLASCGLPCPGVEVRLFDQDMNEVPAGAPGEICVRSPLVMEGYWKRPEATAEAFRGGWLHTGDVATKDTDGYLTIVDRTKEMIISGGFNIYPREVEDALLSHPSVSSAAVIGVPDPKWGEAVTAFVMLRPGAKADSDTLQAHVKAKRGAPWSPKTIVFVDDIPVTGLGKVDRKALRAQYWKEGERQVS